MKFKYVQLHLDFGVDVEGPTEILSSYPSGKLGSLRLTTCPSLSSPVPGRDRGRARRPQAHARQAPDLNPRANVGDRSLRWAVRQALRLRHLRQVSAVLSQDYQILGGVSVMQSVGLGGSSTRTPSKGAAPGQRGGLSANARAGRPPYAAALCGCEGATGGMMSGHALQPTYERLKNEANVSRQFPFFTSAHELMSVDQQAARNSASLRA
jgi:hypothetical protein